MTDTPPPDMPPDASPHDWSELMSTATPETLARALLRPANPGDTPSS